LQEEIETWEVQTFPSLAFMSLRHESNTNSYMPMMSTLSTRYAVTQLGLYFRVAKVKLHFLEINAIFRNQKLVRVSAFIKCLRRAIGRDRSIIIAIQTSH